MKTKLPLNKFYFAWIPTSACKMIFILLLVYGERSVVYKNLCLPEYFAWRWECSKITMENVSQMKLCDTVMLFKLTDHKVGYYNFLESWNHFEKNVEKQPHIWTFCKSVSAINKYQVIIAINQVLFFNTHALFYSDVHCSCRWRYDNDSSLEFEIRITGSLVVVEDPWIYLFCFFSTIQNKIWIFCFFLVLNYLNHRFPSGLCWYLRVDPQTARDPCGQNQKWWGPREWMPFK